MVDFTDGFNSAILRYNGAPAIDPNTTQQATQNLLQETDLHPYIPIKTVSRDQCLDAIHTAVLTGRAIQPGKPIPGGVDKAIPMDFSFNGTNFFINNATFIPPTVPVLLQILSGAQSAQSLLPRGSIYELPLNSSIEISFPGAGSAPGSPHPFHLHGVS